MLLPMESTTEYLHVITAIALVLQSIKVSHVLPNVSHIMDQHFKLSLCGASSELRTSL